MFTDPAVPLFTNRPLISESPRPEQAVTFQASHDAWYSLARAYWDAGHELLQRARNGDPNRAQLLTPAVFLIRHSVELHLKSQILDAKGLTWTVPTAAQKKILNAHRLSDLWSLLEASLADVGSTPSDPAWHRVRKLVHQLDALDQFSFAFRYPVDKKGGDTIVAKDLTIDVEHFASVLGELNVMLTGTSAWLGELRGYEA